LLTSVPVVPSEDQDDGQADQEKEERDLAELWRPLESLADVLQALRESPRRNDVDHSPLDDLAPAQPGPQVLNSTLCRRVGQSTAPMASECSSGLPAAARGKHVPSDPKAATHAVSQRTRHKCAPTTDNTAGVN
jgi:hypothetical protein